VVQIVGPHSGAQSPTLFPISESFAYERQAVHEKLFRADLFHPKKQTPILEPKTQAFSEGHPGIVGIRSEFPEARIIVLTTYTGDVQVLRSSTSLGKAACSRSPDVRAAGPRPWTARLNHEPVLPGDTSSQQVSRVVAVQVCRVPRRPHRAYRTRTIERHGHSTPGTG
jgi:hypothetical protein